MRWPLLLLALLLVACDRPLIDEVGVDLFTTVPDLGLVQFDDQLELRLRPSRFEGYAEVFVNTVPAAFDSTVGAFVFRTTLEVGLNTLRVSATDEVGNLRADTLYAVYLPVEAVPLPGSALDEARDESAAALLPDGRVVVTGGVAADGQALSTAAVLDPAEGRVSSRSVALAEPRAGHTASVLPDGRILLLGGARVRTPASPTDFTRTAELVSAQGASGGLVPIEGGIARAGHTTRVLTQNADVYVYVYGGVIPAGSGTTVSGTVDIYRFDDGPQPALVRLTPEGGAGGFEPATGHVQTFQNKRASVVLGRTPQGGPLSFLFDWRVPGAAYPFELLGLPLSPPREPRTDAAAVSLNDVPGGAGLTLLVGGLDARGEPVPTLEVYAAGADRAFRVPAEVALRTARSGHTATILPAGRILVSGGRSASGDALSTIEAFQF